MKINTITCQHVYNYGASLQAFALQEFLESLGHNVEIINFNPWFHRDRYNPFWYPNDGKYASAISQFPILKYLCLPFKAYLNGMFKTWGRKLAFDKFEKEYYHLTTEKYFSSDDLKQNPPMADAYIAGSDQIWNTFSYNGREAAYYLDFGSNVVKRISYAASLSTKSIYDGYEVFVTEKLKRFNAISVREKTGAILLEKLGISNVSVVLDPVFLLDEQKWKTLAQKGNMYGLKENSYIVVYDFLGNDDNMVRFVKEYAKKNSLKIVSINDFSLREYADKNINDAGPLEFIALISKAACVVANSFHATAFSLIFGKEFYTFNLQGYNNSSRMKDLLVMIGLCERLNPLKESDLIDYSKIKKLLIGKKLKSKEYIYNSLKK